MPAYVVAFADVTDPAGMERYRAEVGAVIARYGGKFVAAGTPEAVEGDIHPRAAAIIEFPSMEQARTWYDAPDYQELKELRQRSSRGAILFMPGLPG
jgi:uncharacterized protein (DUF1330 family)